MRHNPYNGIPLHYARAVEHALRAQDRQIAVLIGGKLNQIADNSNSDLPVDVTKELSGLGVSPCQGLDEMLQALQRLTAQE